MQSLGLSPADLATYGRALAKPHTRSVDLRVLNLSGTRLDTLRPLILSGQVNVDADAEVTRSCTLTISDESRSLQFDPDSPAGGALYFHHMIRVWDRVKVPELGIRVACPVFTGPVVKFDRSGDEVSIEAQGKESLALNGVPTLTLPRGHNAITAIRDILSQRCGETQFAFPTTTRRLPAPVAVAWERLPWTVCQQIATSLGLHLYYDGNGTCRLRDMPESPVFTFQTGEDSNITEVVQVSHDLSTIRNRVRVVGSTPANSAVLNLDDTHPGHPFSPKALAVSGKQMYLTEEITASYIGSFARARSRCVIELKKMAQIEFGASLNAVPVPHLDELDLVSIVTDEHTGTERVRQMSFPLAGQGEMTVGYNDVIANFRRKIRRP